MPRQAVSAGAWLFVTLLLVFYCSYVLAGAFGQKLAIIPGVAITLWAPAGFFAASLILSKKSTWPYWIAVACLAELTCNQIWFRSSISMALIYFSANAGEALITATLIQRWVRGQFTFDSIQHALLLVCIGGVISPIFGATIIAWADATIGKHPFHVAFPLTWLGDSTGFLISSPLAISVVRWWQNRSSISMPRFAEAATVFALIGIVDQLAVSNYLPTVYFVMPLLLWAAVRFQLTGAAAALALITVQIATLTTLGQGEFSGLDQDPHRRMVMLQFFLGIAAMSSILVAALSLQHKQAIEALALMNDELEQRVEARTAELSESEARFRQMADDSPVIVWVTDAKGACTFLNKAWYNFTGQVGHDGLGLSWAKALHPDDEQHVLSEFLKATDRQQEFRVEYRLRTQDGEFRWVINSAAPRLGNNREFLGHVGTVIDISDHRDAENNLREADRRKDEFLATLGHELRNPLAAVQSSLELLKLSATEPETLKATKNVMERQLRQIILLIDDLMDTNRVTHGKIQLHKSIVPIRSIIEQAVEACMPQIEANGHELSIDACPNDLLVEVDRARMAQVVTNLIANSIRYTPQGGLIRVSTSCHKDDVCIRVQDNGIGIPNHMLERVFDIFTQVDREGSFRGGLGIGLALAKAIVELHGGSIRAHSSGTNQGSEFTVSVPLVAVTATANASSIHSPMQATNKHRILIVDDNVDAANMLSILMKTLKHESCTANSGEVALHMATEFQPSVVIMDLSMPRMNGYETLEKMKQESWSKDCTFVALTGWGNSEDRHRTAQCGFHHHFVKPMDLSLLNKILATPATGRRLAARTV